MDIKTSFKTMLSGTKRRRTQNTSPHQFEMYLEYMENDKVFRSGIINPTLEDDYINKKWATLVAQLNATDDGPIFSVKDWKRRFTDWKYATKSKYRKMIEHRNQTGAGPSLQLRLTEYESRGISVWGPVTVTGSPYVNTYDGIALEDEMPQSNSLCNISTGSTVIIGECSNTDTPLIPFDVPSTSESNRSNKSKWPKPKPVHELPQSDSLCNIPTGSTVIIGECSNTDTPLIPFDIPSTSESNRPNKSKLPKPKPIHELARTLIEQNNKSTETSEQLVSILSNFCDNYIDVKREKLKFEIAKYKFENPNFQYQ